MLNERSIFGAMWGVAFNTLLMFANTNYDTLATEASSGNETAQLLLLALLLFLVFTLAVIVLLLLRLLFAFQVAWKTKSILLGFAIGMVIGGLAIRLL
jgi:hypothetical protein